MTVANRPPLAYIRYVHAVTDAAALDFKFVDQIEYSPHYANSTYRTIGIYQGVEAGNRQWKVFRNSTDINIAQQVVAEGTTNFVAGTRYTILHRGTMASNSVVLITETLPTQDAGTHISVTNASMAAQDVFIGAPAGTPLFANVATGTKTTYAARAALTTFTLHTAANGTLVSLASATPFVGLAGTETADPIGGYSVAGSQMSAFLFAPGTGAAANSVSIVMDRQPPPTVPE
ncbi:MAG: DUF4397 domain-containing protein [Gemmatimonadaceae bacterium]|nr:DUF4397 domain-containing protein [Gemmatimonadaceae bacterium]